MVGCHHAALFDRVIEQRQRSGGTMGTANFQAHFLQDAGNGVTHSGGRRQGKVHNAKGHIQTLTCFHTNDLTHTGNAEGGLLDGLRHHVKGLTLHALQGVIHNTGAGNTHIQLAFRLTHTVESAGHKGVILHSIGKHHQFGAAEAILVRGDFRGLLDDSAHLSHRVHIDAGLGRTHVDAGADTLCSLHGFGNGIHQNPVTLGTALLHQRGETADEVHTTGLGSLIHSNGQRHIGICVAAVANNGNRGDGNTLIDNGNTKFPFDLFANLHKILRLAGNLIIDPLGAHIHILMGAIQ